MSCSQGSHLDHSSSYVLLLLQAKKLEDLEATLEELAAAEPLVDESGSGVEPPGTSHISAASGGLCASRDKYDGSVNVRFSLLKDAEGSFQAKGDSPPPEDTETVWLNTDMKCPPKVGKYNY